MSKTKEAIISILILTSIIALILFVFRDVDEAVDEHYWDTTPYYTQEEVDAVTDELLIAMQQLSQKIEWIKEHTVYDLEVRVEELEEYNVWLEDALDDAFDDVQDRFRLLEEHETYNQDEIYVIVYLYELEKSKSMIIQLAIDEDRELTSSEELLILGYELLINANQDYLDK